LRVASVNQYILILPTQPLNSNVFRQFFCKNNQIISGFMNTYLNLNQTEEQTFKAAISTMGLDQREEYMEIITSWEKKALEQVVINSLREGLSVEVVARITGLTIERVQQLQAQLQVENNTTAD
jgi:hypothetical protein